MVEIRPIRADEFEEYFSLGAYAFLGASGPEVLERARRIFKPEWSLAAFEGGRLRARVGVLPLAVRLNGAGLPMGGVMNVSTWPEDRRRGLIATLLRKSLERMREQGQVVSMLFPTFYPVYHRLGWALAASDRLVEFAARDLEPLPNDAPGEFERVTLDEWPLLQQIYDRYIEDKNGRLERPHDWWWTTRIIRGASGERDVAVWRDTAGEPQGYVIYRRERDEPATPHGLPSHSQRLFVREIVALSAAAYRAALRFVALHDLAQRVTWLAPEDDPLPSLTADPRPLRTRLEPSYMLRVVDMAAALAARPCPGVDRPQRLVLRVRDDICDWNDGTWLVEAEAGRACVKATDATPDVSADARELAAMFNGFLSPRAAFAAGLIEVDSPAALAAAGRLFAANGRPHCSDYF